jgi:hypothetical protein
MMPKQKQKQKQNKNKFNTKLAEETVKSMESVINTLLTSKEVKDGGLHIVIGNRKEILLEYSIGTKEKWKFEYDGIARSKYKITAKEGLPTHVVFRDNPELASYKGNTLHPGSYIKGKVVVSVSGLSSALDEQLSYLLVIAIKTLLKMKLEAQMLNGNDFVT